MQMRFPTAIQGEQQQGSQLNYPVGSPHQFTLLDGEMVVDQDKASGTFVRRWASVLECSGPTQAPEHRARVGVGAGGEGMCGGK